MSILPMPGDTDSDGTQHDVCRGNGKDPDGEPCHRCKGTNVGDPIPRKGRQGVFELPADVAEAVAS